ncbi:RNA polymerase sigma-70 factor [Chryseolinea sp. T2]|uniref:RNA polymerase sigma-70 factor n=1 Tax=Chryseolinea sp. T2 TaxID=3129255 RepID=UPI0030772467
MERLSVNDKRVERLVNDHSVDLPKAATNARATSEHASTDHAAALSSYTDIDLLEAIRHDREDAFAELFRRYWQKVHDMAFPRVRSEEITAEIVQDLFISLWDKRASHSIKHLPSYFYTAVKNKALNYIQAQMVRKSYRDYCLKYFPVSDDNTEKTVEFDDLMDAIEAAMQQLPEKSRTVFQLNRLEGRSIPEIADTLNLSEKAIGYHLTQSLKKLRYQLKDYLTTLALALILFY